MQLFVNCGSGSDPKSLPDPQPWDQIHLASNFLRWKEASSLKMCICTAEATSKRPKKARKRGHARPGSYIRWLGRIQCARVNMNVILLFSF